MNQTTTLRALKQSFRAVLPGQDGRTALSPLEFVTGLVFCFLSDSKSFGLEAMRRFLIARFEVSISKGAFWERLAGARLKRQLQTVLAQLMSGLSAPVLVGRELLQALNVTGIYLIDSSTLTLWHGARKAYPGAWTSAALKWHACFDLLSGELRWFQLSAGATNDRQCFPSLQTLAGKLLLFDLGYWDYALLLLIDAANGFFLSRVKTNSAIRIEDVVSGLPRRWIGHKLSAFKPQRKHKNVLEALGRVMHDNQSRLFRLVGFWNPSEKKYHWYVTNLTVAAYLLYALYRLRWTLELIFKASKRSFNLDQRVNSNNAQIIESLVLSSIIASFASTVVLHQGSQHLSTPQLTAISFQRLAHVVVQLAAEFIDYITLSARRFAQCLVDKIRLFAAELFEKNYRHRPTSLGRVTEFLAV